MHRLLATALLLAATQLASWTLASPAWASPQNPPPDCHDHESGDDPAAPGVDPDEDRSDCVPPPTSPPWPPYCPAGMNCDDEPAPDTP
ncbi:hypothetical protein [Luteimonas aquatica]|uniref:hypothetical protein n=1 Tax=Luteimonas aquatica TaxID=450364 RepID=UPI001F587913|nr:hypothetical protein [Luteimonas aquatica]